MRARAARDIPVDRITRGDGIHGTRSVHARRIYAYAAMGRPHAHDVARTCLAHQHVAASVYYDVSDAHMSVIDTACARCTCICVLFYGDFTCLHLICTPTPSHMLTCP